MGQASSSQKSSKVDMVKFDEVTRRQMAHHKVEATKRDPKYALRSRTKIQIDGGPAERRVSEPANLNGVLIPKTTQGPATVNRPDTVSNLHETTQDYIGQLELTMKVDPHRKDQRRRITGHEVEKSTVCIESKEIEATPVIDETHDLQRDLRTSVVQDLCRPAKVMSAGMSPKAACVSSVAPNGSNTKTRKNNIQCAESVVDYSDPNAFSIKGLPLDHILKLITSWGGARKLKNKTTAQVNAEFLQPLTKSTGLSLCAQYITSDDPSLKYVSKDAKFFISHAWSFQFLDVMDALITFFKENRLAMSEIVWLDLFSNSQWNTASKPFEWWQNTFMNAVKRIGNVVLILEPWSAPLPLTRAWCIFEIYACVATRSLFHVAMTPKQRDKFMTTLRNEPDRFHGILANTSCERSEAFKPSDKESIFSVIRATIGFTKLDQMVFSTFANWTEEQMKQRIADTARNEIESTDWQCALAGFYKLQGKLYQAEVIYRRCLEMHTYIFGEKHEDTLVTLNDLATLLFSAGKFQDAEPLYARCLDIQKEHLGHSHPYTIGTISNLAGLFISQRRYSEAELLYHSILEVAEKEFGAEDPITLAAEGNLAYLYVQLGRLQEAETIFVKCIASNAKKHGIDHPYTLGVMCSLADLFQKQNRHKAAVDLYSECLSGYSRVLGNEHPTTVAIKHVITKTQ